MLKWSHEELTTYCVHHRLPNYLTATEYTACILTIALKGYLEESRGTHAEAASTFECPHSWGSFTHLIQLFNYLFVNLVLLQISLGRRNYTLSRESDLWL